MPQLQVPFYGAIERLKTLFFKKMGLPGLVQCIQFFCMALAITAAHTFLLPPDLWGLALVALTAAALSAQLYYAKSRLIGKAMLLQFLVGCAVGLAICVIFPAQWYWAVAGVFITYAVWSKLRPGAFGGLGAVIFNVLFFDFMMPVTSGRFGEQALAVLIGGGLIVGEAMFGVGLAMLASRLVNYRASDALLGLARGVNAYYANLFGQVVQKKRIRTGVAEVRAERAAALSAEARRIQTGDKAEVALAALLAESIGNAYYHLYIFSQIKMNFTREVKDEIAKSPYLFTDAIKNRPVEPPGEWAGFSYMHTRKFVMSYDAFRKLLDQYEERDHGKHAETGAAKNG